MDKYHDEFGNRIRLDTELLERSARHSQEYDKAKERADYIDLVCWVIRWGCCVFCGAFALRHVDVVFRHGSALLELIGVLFAVGYIAQTMLDARGGADDQER